MKLQRTTGDGDRLTDPPEPILLHVLSMLVSKEVVRTSVLSSQWRFLWKSVPMSVSFHSPKVDEEQTFSFCLSKLESKGWLFPPSRWKFLKLNAALEQLDYPGVCTFLLSSPDPEILVFDWNNPKPIELLSRRYLNEDEQSRRFEAHYFNCSLLHLKTIKFINFNGKLH